MSNPPNRLNDEQLRDAALVVADRVGQPGPVARIHRQANGVFRTGHGSIIRIACSDQDWAELSVVVAKLLQEQGKRAVRLDPRVGERQPLSVMGTLATVWTDAGKQAKGVSPPAAVIGDVLRDLHSTKVPSDAGIATWNPFPEWRDRLAKAKGLSLVEQQRFLELIGTLESKHETLNILPTHLVHLDPEPSNVLWDGSKWVVCDFDNFRLGPPEADLAASWAGEHCFKRQGEFEETLRGYRLSGSPRGPVLDHCVRTKLLFHAMAGLPHATTKGHARNELSRRLSDVYEGGDFGEKEPWTPFARQVERDLADSGPHVLEDAKLPVEKGLAKD